MAETTAVDSRRSLPMTEPVRVLIADDHPLVVSALTNLLSRERDLHVIGDARSYAELWEVLSERHPDVLVLDIGMPEGEAVDALHRLGRRHPDVRVLVLSGLPEEEYVVRMIDAGAAGYAQKESDPSMLVEAVRQVGRGDMFVSERGAQALARSAAGRGPDHEKLSDRELQVLRLLGEGKSVTDIGAELHLSPKTVSTYRTRLMEKMDFSTTAEIIRYAVQRGLVD